MKNNKIYCKFVSQVKSSQVKSSAKIISLIALFILLFSISCKPKQNPTPKYSDLVGTWKAETLGGHGAAILKIDSDGNLIFNCGLKEKHYPHYNYTGKIADNFDYPYTIELTFTISSLSSCSAYNSFKHLTPQSKTSKFTFTDASTCTASVNMIGYDSSYWWGIENFDDYKYNTEGGYYKYFNYTSLKKQ